MKYKKYMFCLMSAFMICVTFMAIKSLGTVDAPAVEAFAKNENIGKTVSFEKADFITNTSKGNKLDAIIISDTPQSGTLKLSEQVLEYGDIVDFGLIEEMTFSSQYSDREILDSFSFLPVFSKTGMSNENVKVTISISDRVNNAPVAVNCEYDTYTDVKLCNKLKAVDADGDDLVFKLVSKPKKGEVVIEGDGFCYTPKANKSGKDSFEFCVTDKKGAVSNTAKVIVNIRKTPSGKTFSYSDMENSSAHYAALYLRENGIIEGETFGQESFFYPEEAVSRAQFITMIASVSELSMPTVSVGTGLSDNESIPVWARPYVAAAINSGVIKGENSDEGNKVFRAEDMITRAEAASILDRALTPAKDGRSLNCADKDSVPVWAMQSIVNTSAIGVFPLFDDNTVRASECVTREDAAVMLYEALKYIENENKTEGLFKKLFG